MTKQADRPLIAIKDDALHTCMQWAVDLVSTTHSFHMEQRGLGCGLAHVPPLGGGVLFANVST